MLWHTLLVGWALFRFSITLVPTKTAIHPHGCRGSLDVGRRCRWRCLLLSCVYGQARQDPARQWLWEGGTAATPFTCSSLLGNEAPLSGGSSVFSPGSKAKHRKAPEKCAVHLKQHQPNTVLQAKHVPNEKQRGSLFTQCVENQSPFPSTQYRFFFFFFFFYSGSINVFLYPNLARYQKNRRWAITLRSLWGVSWLMFAFMFLADVLQCRSDMVLEVLPGEHYWTFYTVLHPQSTCVFRVLLRYFWTSETASCKPTRTLYLLFHCKAKQFWA